MSTLKVNALQAVSGGASGPIADIVNGTARAFVNFNGTGTVAIRASYNVSSITDNGTGDYTINFSAAFADVNYAPVFGGEGATVNLAVDNFAVALNGQLTSSLRMYCINSADGTTKRDAPMLSVVMFR